MMDHHKMVSINMVCFIQNRRMTVNRVSVDRPEVISPPGGQTSYAPGLGQGDAAHGPPPRHPQWGPGLTPLPLPSLL